MTIVFIWLFNSVKSAFIVLNRYGFWCVGLGIGNGSNWRFSSWDFEAGIRQPNARLNVAHIPHSRLYLFL